MWYSKGIPKGLKINNKLITIIKNEKELLGLKNFMIPFFILHFGMFMFAHLIFLLLFVPVFFGGGFSISSFIDTFILIGVLFLSLFVSHGISYLSNYICKKEYEKADVGTLMFAPYPRIIIMHFTVLVGAALGAPLLILIFGKIFFDIWGHLNERRKFQTRPKEKVRERSCVA